VHLRSSRFAAGLASVLVSGLVVAGCGDDDDGGGGAGFDAGAGADETTTTTMTPTTQMELGVVKTYDDLSADHVSDRVDYPQTPPVGGPHWQVWQDCGFYDEPVFNETAVHSMEHGAVWITYRPDLPADQVDQIRTYAEQPYVLASPWEDDSLPAPVVLTAWGAQLGLDSLPSAEADQFLVTYREGPTAPEPGAPCTDGLDLSAAEAEAEGLVDDGG